jgi:hypothetical protein
MIATESIAARGIEIDGDGRDRAVVSADRRHLRCRVGSGVVARYFAKIAGFVGGQSAGLFSKDSVNAAAKAYYASYTSPLLG